MTNMITKIEDEAKELYNEAKAAIAPAAKVAEAELEAAGSATASYIKANGLQAGYKIAVSVVGGAAVGQPWATTLATILAEAKTAEVSIVAGAEAILAAQAQADLIAVGKLLPPAATPAA